MTLENIYYIGQTIAVLVIIASLIVLIIQMRQSNRIMSEAAIQKQVEGLQNISRVIVETPGMAEVWNRGNADFWALSDEDRVRFTSFFTYAYRVWEGLHAQYLNGRIDADLWSTHAMQLRDISVLNGAKEVWKLRQHLFSDAFARFYNDSIDEGAARDIFGVKYLKPEGKNEEKDAP